MIELNEITKVFNKNKENEFTALKGVSCEIKAGELAAIIGRSGAGKSTLLHIIACLDTYQNGEYHLDGELINGLSERQYAEIRNKKIGFIKQDFALIEDFTAIENVMIPLVFAKRSGKEKKSKALAALKTVGIEELSNKKCGVLSGGQKQRVAIARAIVNEPDIILADEPTGALDTKTTEEIIELFKELNANGKTIIIVTHETAIAQQCRRIIEMSDGKIISDVIVPA